MGPIRVLVVLPAIPDELDELTKNALAIRNQATTEGICPICGCTPNLHLDRLGIPHLVFEHGDACPARRDPYDWRDLEGAA
jgi:hypothetical protein